MGPEEIQMKYIIRCFKYWASKGKEERIFPKIRFRSGEKASQA